MTPLALCCQPKSLLNVPHVCLGSDILRKRLRQGPCVLFFFSLFSFLKFSLLHLFMCVSTCRGVYEVVRGQFVKAVFSFHHVGLGWNSCESAQQQVALLADPSCWPTVCWFKSQSLEAGRQSRRISSSRTTSAACQIRSQPRL